MSTWRYIDPIVIAGTLLGVAISVTLVFLTSTIVLIGLAVSLLATLLSFQLETIARIERRADREDDEAHLISVVRGVDWLLPVLVQTAESIAATEQARETAPIFAATAKRQLEECDFTLQDLKRGQLRTPVEDTSLLFEQFENVTRSIQAISIEELDSALRWTSEGGQRYWEANKAARARNVKIQRIFVYRKWTGELSERVRKQVDVGIDVRVVEMDKVRPQYLNDLAIWDGKFLSEVLLNTHGAPIQNAYSAAPVDIERRLREFFIVHDTAEPATDSILAALDAGVKAASRT